METSEGRISKVLSLVLTAAIQELPQGGRVHASVNPRLDNVLIRIPALTPEAAEPAAVGREAFLCRNLDLARAIAASTGAELKFTETPFTATLVLPGPPARRLTPATTPISRRETPCMSSVAPHIPVPITHSSDATNATKVLVVSTNYELRQDLALRLQSSRWSVREAISGAEALERIDAGESSLVLLDPALPDLRVEEFRRGASHYPQWRSSPSILTPGSLWQRHRRTRSASS